MPISKGLVDYYDRSFSYVYSRAVFILREKPSEIIINICTAHQKFVYNEKLLNTDVEDKECLDCLIGITLLVHFYLWEHVGKKIAKSLKTRGIDSGVKELNKHHKAIKKDIKAELEKYTSFGTKTIPTSKNFQINDAEDHIKRYEKVLKSYLEEEKESADDEAESAASDNNDFRKESPLTNKESGNTCFDLNVYLINKKCSKRRLVISMDFVFSVVAGIIIGLIFNGGII